jgi:Arc/MetJ-type ribon-helix-helix transcriptional regulator
MANKADLHEVARDGIKGRPEDYPEGGPERYSYPMSVRQLAAQTASVILGRTIPEDRVIWNRRLINRVYGWAYRHAAAPGDGARIDLTAAHREAYLTALRAALGHVRSQSPPDNGDRTREGVQINVRVDADLADRVDTLIAAGVAASRPEAARTGLTLLVDQYERRRTEAAIIEGYRQLPQRDDDGLWSDEATRRMIAEEPW